MPLKRKAHDVRKAVVEACSFGGRIEALAVVDQRAGDLIARYFQIELTALQEAIVAFTRLVDLFGAYGIFEGFEPRRTAFEQRGEAVRLVTLVEIAHALHRGDHAIGFF